MTMCRMLKTSGLIPLLIMCSVRPAISQAGSIALTPSYGMIWNSAVLSPPSELRAAPPAHSGFGSETYMVEGAVLGGLLLGIPLAMLYTGRLSSDYASSSGDTLLGLAGVATGAIVGGLVGSLLHKSASP